MEESAKSPRRSSGRRSKSPGFNSSWTCDGSSLVYQVNWTCAQSFWMIPKSRHSLKASTGYSTLEITEGPACGTSK